MSVTELRDHVEADPSGVREEALRASAPRPTTRSGARVQWAIGLAERELGHLEIAAGELRSGVALADDAGDAELAAGLRMSLAVRSRQTRATWTAR